MNFKIRGRLTQAWIVVISLTLIMTVTSGARFLYGVVLKPLSEEFGWSRADLTIAVVINTIVLSAFQPVIGSIVDRFGSRLVLRIGVVALGLILIPISFASQLWHFYLLYGVAAALALVATSPVNITSLVSGWFTEKRGTALALATSGSAFGQLLIVPLAALTLDHTDWPTVYRGLSVVLLVIGAPVAFLLVREAPRSGRGTTSRRGVDERGEPLTGVGLRDALNTSAFWLLAFGFFVCGFTMAFANTHFVAYADDMGMGTVEASNVIAVTAVFSIVGSLLLGMAADRYRRSAVLALTYFLRGAAFVLLALLPVGRLLDIYAVVLGISWTATTPLTAAIATDLYGRAKIGVVFGTMFTFMNIGFGAGAFLDGLVYDSTGSYDIALIINAIFGVLAAIAVFGVSGPLAKRGRLAAPAVAAGVQSSSPQHVGD